MMDVFNALEILHKQGYIHNDIKTDNIMLDSDHNAVLVDLGFTSSFINSGNHISPSKVELFSGNLTYSSYH